MAGSTYDDLGNQNKLDSYQLVDLRSAYRFTSNWQVEAKLSNLFDEDYQTARFYNQPGREVFFTLRYQPQ